MKKSRRDFCELSIRAGLAFPLLMSSLASCRSKNEKSTVEAKAEEDKLNILILGGTSFLGPHQIAYALKRGHSVTTFTRGKTKPSIHKDLYQNIEQLIGDRNDNLTALHGRKWDAVIDNSGRKTEWTQQSAGLLKDSCERYLYTSSTGVFYPYINSDFTENDQVLLTEPKGELDEEQKLEYGYGVMKAQSEIAAINAFGAQRTTIVRPTYMIGPADRSNRFIHWPIRLSKGGETLVPGKANDPVQYIDVRDAAEWMIRLLEQKKSGTFNAVGPKKPQTMYAFMDEAKMTFEKETTWVKIDDYNFLIENGIHHIVPWIMPVGNNVGSAKINNQKALQNGLTFRPITQSIKDTYEWWNSDAVSQVKRDAVELNAESILVREQEIIKKWKAHKS